MKPIESLGLEMTGGRGWCVCVCVVGGGWTTYACLLMLPPSSHTDPRLFSGAPSAWLGSHQCHQSICAHGLGALQGEAQGSTPHQLGQHAEGPGHAEQHSVVIHLAHPVVLQTDEREREGVRAVGGHRRQTDAWSAHAAHLQQHSAVGVYIGPGVLGLALLQQHVGHDLIELGNHLEHGVVGQVLQGKLALTGVTGVGLPQDGMAVTRHNLQGKNHRPSSSELCCDDSAS